MISIGNNHSIVYCLVDLFPQKSVGGNTNFVFCATKCLLALTFIFSSADELLVQVDDSELSKLVLI